MRTLSSFGVIVFVTSATVACGPTEFHPPRTLRWNFRVGDRYVYKTVIDFPGDDLKRFKAEVIEEIEVLIDHGGGDFRLGVRIQEVNATWKDGEWRSAKPTPLPDEGVPFLVQVIARSIGKYAGVSVTDRGFLMGSKECNGRVEALREPDVRRPGGAGFTKIPFEELLLPKSQVSAEGTWREASDPMVMGSDLTTIVHEGRLLAVGEGTSEFECKMAVTHNRHTAEPRRDWDAALADTESRVRVKWRNDVGLLEHCVLEDRMTYGGKSGEGRRIEVKLLSVIRKERGK